MRKRVAKPGGEPNRGKVIDLSLTAVPDHELRRRAAEGDERALVEKARRQAQGLAVAA